MAFMVPVMKNNYDIYKDNRSRKTSECSNTSASSGNHNGPSLGRTNTAAGGISGTGKLMAMNGVPQRKSKSYANMPPHNPLQMQFESQRLPMSRSHSHKVFPKNGQRAMPSAKSFCETKSMRSGMTACSSNESRKEQQQHINNKQEQHSEKKENATDNHSDLNKFHHRLLDKLRRSFSKDNGSNRP